MKFNKFFMGLGVMAALSLAACSNDEPANGGSTGDNSEGTTMYLNVNITDANNARSRDAGYNDQDQSVTEAGEGDYVFGSTEEHSVNSADFLFYDAQGRFVTRANVWQAATGNNPANVEYMGKNTLVLRNLTKENLPTYLITVLNAPTGFAASVEENNWSMEETRMKEFDILTSDKYFVMSTTSFLVDEENDRYDNAHYYATKLKTTDFLTEEPTVNQVNSNAVSIYVERLAAKFQLTGLSRDGYKEIDVTIAGNANGENGGIGNVENGFEVPSASTKVYVKIEGYGLTGQEPNSYLSKNLDGFTLKSTDLWEGWNHPAFYRSYWGKSMSYTKGGNLLTYSTFKQDKNDPLKPIYGIETTNSLSAIRYSDENNRLRQSKVTNMIITARVYEKLEDGTYKELDLVEYNGVYFRKDQYIKYVLGKLLAAEGLQYWTNEVATTTTTEVYDEENKQTVTTNVTTYKYDALKAEDFTCNWYQPTGSSTGEIKLKYTPAEGVTLYKKGEGWKEGDKLEAASDGDVNKELADFNSSSKAIAYNSGAMYYNIPIEHLVSTNQSSNYQVTAEGNYGVVRNHWYQINVNKVMSLGHGIFKPGDLEGETESETIIPDDENTKERFALAATINILSWKIVKQEVDL